jgi:hypothetical protein
LERGERCRIDYLPELVNQAFENRFQVVEIFVDALTGPE